MKESVYKNYDELPLFLNSATVAKVLGVSSSSAYELMHEPGFPVLRVGSRMVVPKEQFIQWVMEHTTLNVYAHVTDEMRQKAADRIDRGIAGVEPPPKPEYQKRPKTTDFQAVKGKYRKPGTECMTQINDHLWEGRYSPKVNGKRIARNVYAPTEEECEQKLTELIQEMKRELAPLRGRKTAC